MTKPAPKPSWLMISYQVPSEPAAPRVAVWRKLKSMGAIYLNKGSCLLPDSHDHLRRLRLIANEISEAGGEAFLIAANGLEEADEARVVARFRADRDEAYEEFIDKCDDFEREVAKEVEADHFTYAELEENDVDLRKLEGWLEKIARLDFYGAPRAAEARERLEGCRTVLDDYARRVFDAQAENR